MDIAIYTLTSELHDEEAVAAVTQEFLGSLGIEYTLRGNDYSDYGQHALQVIYVRTGGTEGIFRRLLPQLRQQSQAPFYLLTSGKSNSLAASMEILSYLQQNYMQGEIIHGSADYIARRLNTLHQVHQAKRKLAGTRYGIIGEPSDWLISSAADPKAVKAKLGIELVEIPIGELIEGAKGADGKDMPERIYEVLKGIVEKYDLSGFTLRCFDLLTAVKNTGCWALAKLNSEGTVAGCEGDVPAMLSRLSPMRCLAYQDFRPIHRRLTQKRARCCLPTAPFR